MFRLETLSSASLYLGFSRFFSSLIYHLLFVAGLLSVPHLRTFFFKEFFLPVVVHLFSVSHSFFFIAFYSNVLFIFSYQIRSIFCIISRKISQVHIKVLSLFLDSQNKTSMLGNFSNEKHAMTSRFFSFLHVAIRLLSIFLFSFIISGLNI